MDGRSGDGMNEIYYLKYNGEIWSQYSITSQRTSATDELINLYPPQNQEAGSPQG